MFPIQKVNCWVLILLALIIAVPSFAGCTSRSKWVSYEWCHSVPLVSRLRGLSFEVAAHQQSVTKRTTTIQTMDLATYGTYQHSVDPSFDYDILFDHQAYLTNHMPGFIFGNSFYNSSGTLRYEDVQSAPCIGCIVRNDVISEFLFVNQYSRFDRSTNEFRVDRIEHRAVPASASFALSPIELKRPSPTTLEFSLSSNSKSYNFLLLPAILDFVMKPTADNNSLRPDNLLSTDTNLQFYYVIDLNCVQCEL
jgi:hypothetical protein